MRYFVRHYLGYVGLHSERIRRSRPHLHRRVSVPPGRFGCSGLDRLWPVDTGDHWINFPRDIHTLNKPSLLFTVRIDPDRALGQRIMRLELSHELGNWSTMEPTWLWSKSPLSGDMVGYGHVKPPCPADGSLAQLKPRSIPLHSCPHCFRH